MIETKQQLIDKKYNEWSILNGTFVCPCGNLVEDDGNCPNNHQSPLIQEF